MNQQQLFLIKHHIIILLLLLQQHIIIHHIINQINKNHSNLIINNNINKKIIITTNNNNNHVHGYMEHRWSIDLVPTSIGRLLKTNNFFIQKLFEFVTLFSRLKRVTNTLRKESFDWRIYFFHIIFCLNKSSFVNI